MIKLNIHSIVDVITNSSSVIYTYQDNSKQVKELVGEILKIAGINDKDPDDIFYYGSFCEDGIYSEHHDYPFDHDKNGYKELYQLKINIMSGKVDKPKWMKNAENRNYYSNFYPSTYLNLIPKDDKYNDLAKYILKVINSIGADGGYNG